VRDGDAIQLARTDPGAIGTARAVQRGVRERLVRRPAVLGFLILLVPSCIIAYGTTIFLFLPCLFVFSLFRPMTGFKVCLLGLVLGALVFVPLTAMDWKSSGPDSGPPTESFISFFLRWVVDPFNLIFPVSGLITAGLYWWLATYWRTWRRGRSIPASQ
jgi:hypothetical protein